MKHVPVENLKKLVEYCSNRILQRQRQIRLYQELIETDQFLRDSYLREIERKEKK